MRYYLLLFRHLFLTLALVCFFQHADGQGNRFQFVTVNSTDSTPLGKISGIAQDNRGFMYLVDQDLKALVRYDGLHIVRYQNNPVDSNTLNNANMEAIASDSEGNIWVGNNNGMDMLDPSSNHIRHIYLARDNERIMVHSIICGKDGWIWAGTSNGLYSLNPKTKEIRRFANDPKDPQSISAGEMWVVYEDREGTIWVGAGFPFFPPSVGGLNRLDRKTGKFKHYLHDPKNPQSLENDNVSALFEDSKGNFWVGTGGDGLHQMDRKNGTFDHFHYDADHPEKLSRPQMVKSYYQDFISFIREDASGRIWIGTAHAGLASYDPVSQKTTFHFASNGYPDKSAFTCLSSKEGILWVASQWSSKLYKYDPFRGPNISWTSNQGFHTFIGEDDQQNLWVGRDDSIFYVYTSGDTTRPIIVTMPPTVANLPARYTLNDVKQSGPQNYWLATSDGIFDFNLSEKSFRRIDHDPSNKERFKAYISSIFNDSEGRTWFTTASGLYFLDPHTNKFSVIQPDESDSSKLRGNASKMVEGPPGIFWLPIWPDKGIDRMELKSKKVKHYFKQIRANQIFFDSRKVLWVCTQRGIYHYDEKSDQFLPLTDTYSDLETSQVFNVLEDARENLWFQTSSYIYRLDSARKVVITFGKSRGVAFNSVAVGGAITKDGKIVMGGANGFYSFYPSEMGSNQHPPFANFLNFYLDNRLVVPGENSLLKSDINSVQKISLAYNENNFAFSYAGLHFSEPSLNKSLYKLENYDLDWREFQGDTMAAYFKVPKGNYVLRVKTRSSQGVWSERSIQIRVNPPWWLSWWAYVLYAVGFVVTALFIYRDEKRKIIRKEREHTRERELMQAKEIEKAYLSLKETQAQLVQSEKMASLGELTAGIAHEIQNPLNFVNNFSELNRELIQDMHLEIDRGNLEEVRKLAADIASNEEKIVEHGKRADSIVKGMLQHSRISTGAKEAIDINALCDEYLRLCYHGLRAKDKTFNANLETHFDPALPKMSVVPQDIGRVLLNICNNAFYAANDKRTIAPAGFQPTVKLSTRLVNSRMAEIRIEDNGNGISQKIMDKIFQPFFTTKPTGQGTGLGLSMSYDIIKTHGGQIRVNSAEGTGTTFIIDIPIII